MAGVPKDMLKAGIIDKVNRRGMLAISIIGQAVAIGLFVVFKVSYPVAISYVALPDDINFGDPKDASIYATASLTLSTGQVVKGSLLDLEATVLKVGGDYAAGTAFVKFLLSSKARHILTKEGYTLLPPALLGQKSAAPSSIRALIPKS